MIAIIELYQHDEVIRHYYNLLKKSDHKVKIFCSYTVYQMLADLHNQPSFEWIVQAGSQSIPDFLKSNYPLIRAAKLVFITTALNNFKAFYQLSTINKTILLVHNAHSFLAPQFFLALNGFNILDRLRWLKITLNRSHFYKKQLLQNLAGLIFPTEIILQYVKNHFDLPTPLQLVTLPFATYRQPPAVTSKNKITITIPCTVISEQRDYGLVLTAIKKISKDLTKEIHLVLLGQPKGDGEKIITAFHKIEGPEIKVTSFSKTIPLQTYENWLKATNFLILPLKQYGKNHIYEEQLGYSKISGGVNDMIRFGVPALIPDYYPLEAQLEKMVERYDSDQLANKILYWVNQNKYSIYRATVPATLADYYPQKMQIDFNEKINLFLKD